MSKLSITQKLIGAFNPAKFSCVERKKIEEKNIKCLAAVSRN